MNNYSKKQFDGCAFNPLTEGKMLQEYPRLSEIVSPEWMDENADGILRFVVMVYDPSSPLIKGERDLNFRRMAAFELAGIDNDELMKLICAHAHRYVSELTIKYLIRFPKSKEWAAVVATEFCFWEGCQKLLEPISGDGSKSQLEAVQKKGLIKDELDKDIKRLDSYYKQFFGGDEDLEKKVKRRGTSPELMAKMKTENVQAD
jgi:hypothetical protein